MSPVSGAAPIDRRAALKLFGSAGLASLAACSRPHEEIIANETLPYVNMPEGMVPGEAQRYATTLELGGRPRGVIVTSFEGRPIKIDGNPRHPASLGATDVFAEAELLSLYDPDRSQSIRQGAEPSDGSALEAAIATRRAEAARDGGAGLRLLTGHISSPTLLDQIAALLQQFPAMRWHVFEPADANETAAARVAFGRALSLRARPADCDVIACFGADPVGPGPDQIRFARGFAQRRKAKGAPSRLYAIESGLSLTGAAADERLAAAPDAVARMLLALGGAFGLDARAPELSPEQQRFVSAIAKALTASAGRGLVLPGAGLPTDLQAFAHAINAKLRSPVDAFEPDARLAAAGTLAELAADLAAGRVRSLIVANCNPAHGAPGELDFERLVARADWRLHLGLYRDETAALCDWHVPLSHPLESWSDARDETGVASIVQPLIRPLYDGHSLHRLVGNLAGETPQSDYDRLRAHWRSRWGEDFEFRWRRALLEGVIEADSAPVQPEAASFTPASPSPARRFSVVFRPDPSVFDGRFANNAWLQECPQPFSRYVWGNGVKLARADAARLGVGEGDEIEVRIGAHAVHGPARIVDAQAAGVVELTLGYGRTSAGAIGDDVGFNVAALRGAASLWVAAGAQVTRTGRHLEATPSTAPFVALDRSAESLAPEIAFDAALPPPPASQPSFNQPPRAPNGDPYAWGMVIDTSSCIGCNACVVACQAENNAPVVGPEEIARGRDMHWLRIDSYESGPETAPRQVFQPVPCMHCETAPCEPVCPVGASVHDHEGLNVQVYNRCVGTRFCEANCPYKVRRFNFFGYADGQEYGNLGQPIVKAVNNPDVSVRVRGVMEKCTYCVQRISRARRRAEKEERTIAEGEVVTACQAACPTQAITFGNLRDSKSRVAELRKDSAHYTLLGELHTRPRTTYLAKRRNADPDATGGRA